MVRRVSQLLIGLVFYGFAGALMVRAELGVDPWTVFAQGLENVTSLSLGVLTVLIGAVVLLLWIPLRQRPGIGTVLNILLIGPALDLGLLFIETPSELWQRVAMFAGGILLLSIATGLYIGSRFGAGPRDGLMTGLTSRFGIPTWIGRTSIEVTVLITGWLLGGDVWFGTLAFAVLIGPMCGITLPLLTVPHAPSKLTEPPHSSVEEAR